MAELGRQLQAAREARGYSVVEAAQGTHIRATYIAAMEQDRFEDLPAPVYARGFLRNYATFLGLDAEDLVATLDHALGTEHKPRRSRNSPEIAGPVWPGPRPRAIAGAVVLVLIFAFVAYLFHQYSDFVATSSQGVFAATPSPTAMAIAPAIPIATVTPIPTLPPSPVAAASPSAAPTRPPPPTPPPTATVAPAASPTPQPTATQSARLALAMQFTGPCWLRVTVDGKQVFEGTLQAGTSKTWDGSQFITIRVGNAGGAMVTFNGRSEGLLGASGQVVEKTYH